MNEESDRAKIEQAMHAYHVFNFAVSAVVSGLGLQPTKEEYELIWQAVKDVAAGTNTLHATPAEIALANPGMTPEMVEAHARSMRQNSDRHQATAKELLAAQQGFRTPPK